MKEDILKKVTESEDFDFESFKEEVISGLKAGRPFLGKDGTVTPLLKQLVLSKLSPF